ncbi:hypothetical protein OP10G_3680 [Fimbriimonas ginsengisoli Gsoil 348]|uniref:Uncharacterized protein n=1 Tax=Fimbriimonas ginsengisoli Gsoil 348 TaxID=661478 RepID=A0A068NU75_FIMGI|nr:hypothetical protein OP10G_3680 [Fimbriimonas ginsengisoli Gsoil 348]
MERRSSLLVDPLYKLRGAGKVAFDFLDISVSDGGKEVRRRLFEYGRLKLWPTFKSKRAGERVLYVGEPQRRLGERLWMMIAKRCERFGLASPRGSGEIFGLTAILLQAGPIG